MKKYSWTLSLLLLLLGAIVVFLPTSPAQGEGDAEKKAKPAAQQEPRPPAVDATEDGERLVAKLIPDQRAMLGAPDTVIDLKEIFAETDLAELGEPLRIEILHNNKDVARAVLNGDTLILKWGQRTGKVRDISLRAVNPKTGDYLDTRFSVELWQPDYLQMILTVIGGLGIFLLGMKHLSDGVQAIAGNRLRRMISSVTDNRVMAVGVGLFVTMLVQSSSITTVITVGFVNAGLMTLAQAIGIIMGANIGTTITGWILVLAIGKYGLPLAGIGAFGYLFCRKDAWRYYFLALMGVGMVFFGLELMKSGFETVKELPEFEAWFQTFQADSYIGVLKCALIGCLLTFIVQSSSATLGIIIGLAQIGVLPFETAAALVLGENIGTTITAWLASLAANTNAKRAAYFHILFNVMGVAWVTAIFPWYIRLIRYAITGDADAVITPDNITQAIAATHTGFNVSNTLVFLPIAGWFGVLLQRIVPDRPTKEKPQFTGLDMRMLESPIIGIEQSRLEVLRMAKLSEKMMTDLRQFLTTETFDEQLLAQILDREDETDHIQQEIVAFISKLIGSNVPHRIVDEARRQLRMADEYESISDYITRIAKAQRKLHRAGLRLPDEEAAKLMRLHDLTVDYLHLITAAEEAQSPTASKRTRGQANDIAQLTKTMMNEFMGKMPTLDPLIDVAYNRQINGYRRIRDHTLNIAQLLAGEK